MQPCRCNPRKLNPDEPWSWLLGHFIQQHRIPTASVHLCWLQWYLQEDIRSLLPEALELVRNKLDVLRGVHLDGFERTQLDALQLDVRSTIPGLLCLLDWSTSLEQAPSIRSEWASIGAPHPWIAWMAHGEQMDHVPSRPMANGTNGTPKTVLQPG